jgi:hypothetical protein
VWEEVTVVTVTVFYYKDFDNSQIIRILGLESKGSISLIRSRISHYTLILSNEKSAIVEVPNCCFNRKYSNNQCRTISTLREVAI